MDFKRLLLLLLAYTLPPVGLSANELSEEFAQKTVGQLTELAVQYEHGEGVSQDYDQAIKLYCRAAKKGHAPAQYQLGWIYANGRGAKRDDNLAAVWFGLAANQGDSSATKMLKLLPQHGNEQDARCILVDGREYLEPIKSVPNPAKETIIKWVKRLAPDYGLAPGLVLAVIEVESNYNVRARSHKNAMGLMQLIPGTASRFGVADVWDPVQNLKGGMAYLSWLLDYFKGDLKLALAGYNAGENAVVQYNGVPPYSETRNYIRLVNRLLDNKGA